MAPRVGGGIGDRFLFALLVVSAAAPRTYAASEARVSVDANYQDALDSHADTSLLQGIPADAQAYSAMDEWDYAESSGVASIAGPVSAYAGAQGAYGGPLQAIATASQATEWSVTSASLASGTPVRMTVAVSFTGSLEATFHESASATASLSLGSQRLYEGGGTGGYHAAVGTGHWAGDFTEVTDPTAHGGSPRLNSRRVYLLDAMDTLTFDTSVGQAVLLTLVLTAEVTAAGAESGAWADFLHSGSYDFIGANDPLTGVPPEVRMQAVPEPAAFTLAALVSATLLAWRRRGMSREVAGARPALWIDFAHRSVPSDPPVEDAFNGSLRGE